ncbi:bcl-2-interacting killer isoform X2 [Mus musculus]|uniref:bcl-2-interacting killer isoform X2 n=1 Tax=Mus musculus TaxID=10090 RepID=UPI0003D6FCBD|nr:bcl-2-interacting killer isoform X2 [Mus musculus]|eukprot:XP_006520417.1 PREDICTED: bcl-2-interacting killer isoform X2 [Mus musculus]
MASAPVSARTGEFASVPPSGILGFAPSLPRPEHMSEARLMARDVIKTVPHDQVPQPPVASETPSMKEPVRDVDLMECVEGRNQVALRLACIGDEMDLCLRSPRLVQLPGIAIHRLAVTYSRTGVRGIFRSLIRSLTNLRENIWSWRVLTPGAWVSPDQDPGQLFPMVLLVFLLLGGAWYLQLQ